MQPVLLNRASRYQTIAKLLTHPCMCPKRWILLKYISNRLGRNRKPSGQTWMIKKHEEDVAVWAKQGFSFAQSSVVLFICGGQFLIYSLSLAVFQPRAICFPLELLKRILCVIYANKAGIIELHRLVAAIEGVVLVWLNGRAKVVSEDIQVLGFGWSCNSSCFFPFD